MTNLWKRGTMLLAMLSITVLSSGCEFLPFTATIELRNNSLGAIEEVYISRSNTPSWGPNQLSSVVPPGEDRTFTVLPGTYDMRAINEFGQVRTVEGVTLRSDDEFVWNFNVLKDGEG